MRYAAVLLFALTALIAIVQKPRAITLPHGGPTISQDWLGRVTTTQRVHVALAQSDKPPVSIGQFSVAPNMNTDQVFVINGSGGDFLVKIHPNGVIEYGKDYAPDEAARVFWQALGAYPNKTQSASPQPEWVPDPSAGHYDCPDGWTAMRSAEPEKWHTPNILVNGMAMGGGPPTLDKKGHVLAERPSPPVCVSDAVKGKP